MCGLKISLPISSTVTIKLQRIEKCDNMDSEHDSSLPDKFLFSIYLWRKPTPNIPIENESAVFFMLLDQGKMDKGTSCIHICQFKEHKYCYYIIWKYSEFFLTTEYINKERKLMFKPIELKNNSLMTHRIQNWIWNTYLVLADGKKRVKITDLYSRTTYLFHFTCIMANYLTFLIFNIMSDFFHAFVEDKWNAGS